MNLHDRIFAAAVLGAGLALSGLAAADAATLGKVPAKVTYRGTLFKNGVPVNYEVKSMRFRIYPSANDPSPVWESNNHTVTVKNGIFTAVLGKSPDSVLRPANWGSESGFVEVEVDGTMALPGTVLSPRQELVSVPFTLKAGEVDGVDVAFNGGGVTETQIAIGTDVEGTEQLRVAGTIGLRQYTGTDPKVEQTPPNVKLTVVKLIGSEAANSDAICLAFCSLPANQFLTCARWRLQAHYFFPPSMTETVTLKQSTCFIDD